MDTTPALPDVSRIPPAPAAESAESPAPELSTPVASDSNVAAGDTLDCVTPENSSTINLNPSVSLGPTDVIPAEVLAAMQRDPSTHNRDLLAAQGQLYEYVTPFELPRAVPTPAAVSAAASQAPAAAATEEQTTSNQEEERASDVTPQSQQQSQQSASSAGTSTAITMFDSTNLYT